MRFPAHIPGGMRLPAMIILASASSASALALTHGAAARVVSRPALCHRCAAPVANDAAPPAERLFATLPYLLPFADGFRYGGYVFANVPGVGGVAGAIAPFVNSFESLPFAGLILFIALSTFTRSSGLSRFVRFNIQQAILLDIALIIPGFFAPAAEVVPRAVSVAGSNFVFYGMALVVGYAIFSNAQGKPPDQVPVLSDAATMQIGPF